MCSESTQEKREGEGFPKTIHDFSRKLEPLGLEYPEDEIPLSPIKPQLDFEPSDIWTEECRRREGEDQPCCGIHDEARTCVGFMTSLMQIQSMKACRLCRVALTAKELRFKSFRCNVVTPSCVRIAARAH